MAKSWTSSWMLMNRHARAEERSISPIFFPRSRILSICQCCANWCASIWNTVGEQRGHASSRTISAASRSSLATATVCKRSPLKNTALGDNPSPAEYELRWGANIEHWLRLYPADSHYGRDSQRPVANEYQSETAPCPQVGADFLDFHLLAEL